MDDANGGGNSGSNGGERGDNEGSSEGGTTAIAMMIVVEAMTIAKERAAEMT